MSNGIRSEAQRLAFVATKHSDEVLDLIVFDDNGQSTMKTSVGRRSPEDYGPEGGGATWHYVS